LGGRAVSSRPSTPRGRWRVHEAGLRGEGLVL